MLVAYKISTKKQRLSCKNDLMSIKVEKLKIIFVHVGHNLNILVDKTLNGIINNKKYNVYLNK